jgi:hypothetical protein
MALIIKSTESKQLNVRNSSINLSNIYGRLAFVAGVDGRSLEIGIDTYESKEKYTASPENMLLTDFPQGSIRATIEASEVQSVETAHKYGKIAVEELGYSCEIDL